MNIFTRLPQINATFAGLANFTGYFSFGFNIIVLLGWFSGVYANSVWYYRSFSTIVLSLVLLLVELAAVSMLLEPAMIAEQVRIVRTGDVWTRIVTLLSAALVIAIAGFAFYYDWQVNVAMSKAKLTSTVAISCIIFVFIAELAFWCGKVLSHSARA